MIFEQKILNELFTATCRVIMDVANKNPLDLVIIDGTGWAYYMSHYDKRIVPIKKGSSWYLLNDPPNEKGEYRLFWPSKLFYGQVIYVPEDHFYRLD